MATYSNRIKELRTMRDMSQQDLGDLLSVNKVTVSQYERGVRKPDINIVAALCDIFNVSSDYLLGKVNKKTTPKGFLLSGCLIKCRYRLR